MRPFSEADAKALLGKVLKLSKADHCEVNLNAQTTGNIRYARNTVSTAGVADDTSMVIQSFVGKKTGVVTLNEFTDESIERAVRASEELARLAPEDPEAMAPLGPQTYLPVTSWFESSAAISAEDRAKVATAGIEPSKAKGCTAAGYLSHTASHAAMANSAGLFAYHRDTSGNLTITVRTNDGLGSGWASSVFNDVKDLDAAATSNFAIEKAVASREAKAIEPGKYTVVLEPHASTDLISFMFFSMDGRQTDEGRSFMAKAGGGTRVGEKLFDERINIHSDPQDPQVPTQPWGGDGRPQRRVDWIRDGVVRQLPYSRFWAAKKGVEAVPFPSNILMAGGTESTEDLVRGTGRGVLVTRTWYLRFVDPQTVLLTGLTRDGTFYIEDGRIKHAIKNMRFNESPIVMLNNVDALGKPVRVQGTEGGPVSLIPPMRVRDFTFSSLSDAV